MKRHNLKRQTTPASRRLAILQWFFVIKIRENIIILLGKILTFCVNSEVN